MIGQSVRRPQLQLNHAARHLDLSPSNSLPVRLIPSGNPSRHLIAGMAIPADMGRHCRICLAPVGRLHRIAVVLELPCMTRPTYHRPSLPLVVPTVLDMHLRPHDQCQNAFDGSLARGICPIRPPHITGHPCTSHRRLYPRLLCQLCQMGPPLQNALRRSFASDTNSESRDLCQTRRYGKCQLQSLSS